MLSLLLPTVVLASAALMSLAVFHTVRGGVFAPTAEPPAGLAGADTLIGAGAMVRTVLNPTVPEWHTATLHSLTEVEDLLDSLEAHGVATREVTAVDSGTFAVRWK